MNCYECALEGEALAGVAVCQHCGAGMCVEHFHVSRQHSAGGMRYGCSHQMPARPPGSARERVPTKLARTTRRPALKAAPATL